MPTHIKLYSEKRERFEEIKRDLTEQLGFEPTNPEVVGFLVAEYRDALDDHLTTPMRHVLRRAG